MLLRKWDYEKHEYEPYIVPDEWECRYSGFDMSEIINCCQCGKEVMFGECYTSLEVHTFYGIGYMVCENCHDVEMERKLCEQEND